MADRIHKKCLLIGNGFNRLNSSSVSWDDLIKKPVEPYKDLEFTDIPKMSYPLKFEYIVNFLNQETNRNDENLYEEIKKQIIDELGSIVKDQMIDLDIRKALIEINPDYIITTNYDTQLEKVFASKGKNYQYSKSLIQKMNNPKHSDTELVLGKTTTLRKVDFYHMHGINVVPRSVCLGYEHYVRIISKLRDKICCDSKHNRLIDFIKGDYCKSINPTYLARFFDSDVYIVGLGLNEEEIDLWWILCYRAYLYFSDLEGTREFIKNKIVYYDVHKEKITSDGFSYEKDYLKQKKALFKYMHVDYQECIVTDSFKDSYLKVLEKIKENE